MGFHVSKFFHYYFYFFERLNQRAVQMPEKKMNFT